VKFTVAYSPRAAKALLDLEEFIAERASAEIAAGYVAGIVAQCDALETFPNRHSPRPDIGSGFRSFAYRGRATILYEVFGTQVVIHGVFYGGQNWERSFRR
jgi:toxin ParE1/3/4